MLGTGSKGDGRDGTGRLRFDGRGINECGRIDGELGGLREYIDRNVG
jgi:hypothetical protein